MTRDRRHLIAALALLAACEGRRTPTFTSPLLLGGRMVDAATLEAGRAGYRRACRPCHGEAGDGKGPLSVGQHPPPRNFTLGVFKFASVPSGALPRDEDLVRSVKDGLRGTAMLGWHLSEPEIVHVVQYLKTLSPRWREEAAGDPVPIPPDPWAGEAARAIAVGSRVYHGLARCNACHPSYVPRSEADADAKAAGVAPAHRADPYAPVATASDFGAPILATDFTRDELRSVRPGSLRDLYRVIAAGVGGTAMPAWTGALPPADLWALTRYVSSIAALRGTPAAEALRRRLTAAR
jgi:mono/diheme cytochrome c family protein